MQLVNNYNQWLKYTFWSPGTLLKCGAPAFRGAPCYMTARYGNTFDTDCFSQSTPK